MEKRRFKDLLQKYLHGRLDDAGRRKVDEWFDAFGYEMDIAPLLDEEKAGRIQKELSGRLESHTRRSGPTPQRLSRWLPVSAAAAFIAVSAVWWIWAPWHVRHKPDKVAHRQEVYDTVRTETGKMKRLVLPDQSVVWLNANTQLRYAAQAFEERRELFIDHGEAFFEVTKQAESPFSVYSEEMVTKVLGTAFNVKNYPELEYVSIQVKAGKVLVSVQNDRLKDTVAAGSGRRYVRNGDRFIADDRFASEAGSWVQGRTLLDNATFQELVLVMHNRFGVTLKSHLPETGLFRYTIAVLQHKSLEETMQLICDIHQIKYRRKGDEITLY